MSEDQNLPQGSEQPQEAATGAETGSPLPDTRSDGSAGEAGNGVDASVDSGETDSNAAGSAEPETSVAEHSHESVLSALLSDLEGIIHMSKTEIIAQVDKARALFGSL